MFLMPGDRIAAFEIIALVGTGATGFVYQVFDHDSQEERAIKVLAAFETDGIQEELLARYHLEAQIVGSLKHPNLLQVYGFGEHQNLSYLVMEYRAAPTLSQVLRRRGQLPFIESCTLITQILDVLHLVHERDIVHRDIKPANILYDAHGKATLIDFGIARLRGSMLTRVGCLMGALGYCAPEQILLSTHIDARADLFSVGTLLYTALAGERPFPIDSLENFSEAVLHQQPRPVSTLVEALPRQLDDLINKALAKSPDARFQTAREMQNAIEQLCQA